MNKHRIFTLLLSIILIGLGINTIFSGSKNLSNSYKHQDQVLENITQTSLDALDLAKNGENVSYDDEKEKTKVFDAAGNTVNGEVGFLSSSIFGIFLIILGVALAWFSLLKLTDR